MVNKSNGYCVIIKYLKYMTRSISKMVLLVSLLCGGLFIPGSSPVKAASTYHQEIVEVQNEVETLKAPFDFDSFYIRLDPRNVEEEAVSFAYATSNNGSSWTPWTLEFVNSELIPKEERANPASYDDTAAPYLISNRVQLLQPSKFIKVKLLQWKQIESFSIFYQNENIYNMLSTEALSKPKPNFSALSYNFDYLGGIPVVTRNQWYCGNQQDCSIPPSSTWDTEYNPVTHFIIHHTATSNTSNNWANEVKAVWSYHANVRGWSDIGYNFLIDPNGVIYEGRFGGDRVTAGHTLSHNSGTVGISMLGDYSNINISSKARDSLNRLLIALSYHHKVDMDKIWPDKTGTTRYGVSGHRDWGQTGCPGNGFYSSMQYMRPMGYKYQGKYEGSIKNYRIPEPINLSLPVSSN
jgi:hypothetical protein